MTKGLDMSYPILNKKTFAIHTLGCKVNTYESDAMRQALEAEGAIFVEFEHDELAEPADICVINTCSVTNIADRKSRQMLRRARRLNPGCVVVAAGCYVQVAADDILKEGLADLLIGTNQKHDAVKIIAEFLESRMTADANRKTTVSADNAGQTTLYDKTAITKTSRQTKGQGILDLTKPVEYDDQFLSHVESHTRAYMKVQEGCNQFCSYCIIPYARGRIRSRSMESVIEEAKALSENGVKEIVLTGIHLSSYGVDVVGKSTLIELIEAISQVDRIERIRFGSLEPRIITEDFTKRLAAIDKICPHFHLSLQSGSDTVLKRMNRHYTCDEYLNSCTILRRYFHDPAITTDIIVGFPGESEEEFAQTMEFVKTVDFYEVHVFQYSAREGTVAAKMPNQIPNPVKKERSEQLIALTKAMAAAYRERLVEKQSPCLVLAEEEEAIGGKTYICGYTKEYVRVALPADAAKSGEIVTCIPLQKLDEEIVLAEKI